MTSAPGKEIHAASEGAAVEPPAKGLPARLAEDELRLLDDAIVRCSEPLGVIAPQTDPPLLAITARCQVITHIPIR